MFPHAIAIENIHIGAIAGIEGSDASTHAERLPDGIRVNARRHVLRVRTLEQMRDPARELHHLHGPGHLAEYVGGNFPCSAVISVARSSRRALTSSRKECSTRARVASDVSRQPGYARSPRPPPRLPPQLPRSQRARTPHPSTGAYNVSAAARFVRPVAAVDPVGHTFHVVTCANASVRISRPSSMGDRGGCGAMRSR